MLFAVYFIYGEWSQKSLDFVTVFLIDYMLCVLLGDTKLLLKLWLEPTRTIENLYSISRHVPVLNKHLKKLWCPNLEA